MHRLFKLVKLAFTKMEEEKIKLKNVENISIEWKELARRLVINNINVYHNSLLSIFIFLYF